MKALLVYTPSDAQKNKSYINSFVCEAEKRNIDMSLMTDGSYKNTKADFVINRSRDHKVSGHFKNSFNNAEITSICNDKLLTWQRLHEYIPMIETFEAGEICPIGFPAIVKPKRGHGGQAITVVNTKEEYTQAVDTAKGYADFDMEGVAFPAGAIAQRALPSKKDMRVYVMGKNIIAAVLREPNTGKLSNFSLGGKASLVKPENCVSDIVNRLTEIFDLGLVGIDFIFDGEKPILNEIEDAVGARMLYSLMPDINLPSMYLDHILKQI